MKKKLLCLMLATMMTMSVTACGNQNNAVGNTQATTSAQQGNTSNQEVKDYTKYIQINDYKNIVTNMDESVLKVSDSEVQAAIDSTVSSYATTKEVTDRVVEDGDTINLDYSGLLDGVAFTGGTATDSTYTVGGNFIEDLDRAFVGMEVGKEYQVPCRFPDNYGSEELKGKDVIFVVTVNYIEEAILPELNDALVAQIANDNNLEVKTTAEFTELVRQTIEEEKKNNFDNERYSEIMTKIMEESTYSELPEDESKSLQQTVKDNVNADFETYGTYYGVATVEDFFAQYIGPYYGATDFDEFAKNMAENYLKEKIAIETIAANEGISITAEEVNEYGEEVAVSNGFDNFEALKSQYGEEVYEEFRYTLMSEKVQAFLLDNVKNEK